MLVPVDEALTRILDATQPITGPAEVVPLPEAGGRVLARSLIAADPHPRFDNSAVDGYALHAEDLARTGGVLRVTMTIASGSLPPGALQSGEAARILTGAPIPPGTAAVVMQEDVDVMQGAIILRGHTPLGANVRTAGADFSAGETLAASGTPIGAGVAGLLASQGVGRPEVFARPKCCIVTTGDEIVPIDAEPAEGQLRDSVSSMLRQMAVVHADSSTVFARDDPDELRTALLGAVDDCHALVIAGGASVGDRDFTTRVVAELGEVDFHGIRMRPGKPLLFGDIRSRPVLALPGNPASAFVCFHLFGIPMLRRMAGWSEPQLTWFSTPFGASHGSETREVIARVRFEDGVAVPVHEQASFGLKSLAAGHALVRLPAETNVRAGDLVHATSL